MQIPKRRAGKWSEVEPDRHITVEKLERIKSELERLKTVDLRQAAEDVRIAAEMGDRSENAAYTEAKSRWNRINSRVLSLQDRVRYAIPIRKGATGGRVRIGSTVTLEADGNEKTYEILGSQESDPSKGRISYLSPLGSILIGKLSGEEVVLKTNGKEKVHRVVRVE